MLTDFGRQIVAGLRLLIVFTVVLGIAYPAAVWALGQTVRNQASGQPVKQDGQTVGSALLGQNFTGDSWFHSRPSANDYDTLASAPTNLGPSSKDLIKAIEERRAQIAKAESVDPSRVPADALTASGSGLDPQISLTYAKIQIPRVALSNGLSAKTVEKLVTRHTDGRSLGFLGEPGVNVLRLNLAVAAARQSTS